MKKTALILLYASFLFFGFSAIANATSYTASVSGNWDSSATWGGAGVPASGDTATINNAITVTVPVGYTAVVGTTPADDDLTTPAITCASTTGTGILIVNGTLRFQGSVKQCNANWTVNGGGILYHDSSLAGTPSAVHYAWQIGMANSQANAILILNGSSGSHVTVTNYTGSGTFGGFTQGSARSARNRANSPAGQLTGAGKIQATYADFSYLGVSGYDWSTVNLGVTGYSYTFDYCTVDNSTDINFTGIHAGASVSFTHSRWTNPVAAANTFNLYLYDLNTSATGTRVFSNNMFEGGIRLSYGAGWTMDSNVIVSMTTAGPMDVNANGIANVTNSLIWNRSSLYPWTLQSGTFTNNAYIRSESASCDGFRTGSGVPKSGLVVQYLLAETLCTGFDGSLIIPSWTDPASVMNSTFSNMLVVPTAGQYGGIFTDEGVAINGNLHYYVKHNTWKSRAAGGGTDFEGTNVVGYSGRLAEFTSNLQWAASSVSSPVTKAVNTPVDGAIVVADYNSSYNDSASPMYNFVAAKYQNTPGLHDVVANPSFVDSTRTIRTWATSIDAAVNTDALIRAKFMLYQSASWDAAWSWSNYIAWVQAGWKPTNAALHNTASDGLDFGAVPFASVTSNDDTVTSSAYTVSVLSGNAGTITNVPSGTSKATFLAALTLATGATWNTSSVADPVVSGNTLVVTAQDGTTTGTYTITVNAVAPTNIITAGVTGFTAPTTFSTPQVFGALTAGSTQYTVTGLTWSPADNPFHAATAYTATVVLTSAATYKFPTGGIAVPTANGGGTVSAGTTTGGDVSSNQLTFTVLFPSTAAKTTPTLSVTNSPLTYNTSPQATTVSGSVAGAVSNIQYNGSGTIPTNAGTYAITADFAPTDSANYNSLSGASAGNFIISTATQSTLTAVSTPSTVAYGTTATLSSSGGSGTGAVTFSVGASTGCNITGGTTLNVSNASGTCTVTATKAADTNYTVISSSATTVTINKASPTALTLVTASGVYPGFTVTSTGGVGNTSATTYSTTNGSATGCTINSSTGALTVTTIGTCNITLGKVTDANWLAATGSDTATVTGATQTATLTNTPINYTGGTLTATASCSGGGTASIAGGGTGTNAGSYATTVNCTATGNYAVSNGLTPTNGNFVISPITPTPSLSVSNSPTYNTSPQAATVVVGGTAGTTSNILYGGSATVPTNAGTYAVTANFTPTDSTNYNSLTAVSAGNYTINKATPTISVSNSPQNYTGAGIAATISGSVAGTPSSILTGGSATQTTAGTYVVTANFAPTDSTNYNSLTAAAAGNFVIAKINQPTLIFTGQTITSPTAFSALSTTGGSGTGSVTYAVTTAGTAGCSITGTTLSYTTAGTCGVTATKATDSNYNSVSSSEATFTINANATHTITASCGANGHISPYDSVSVNNGNDQTFTIIPNSGYHVNTVTADGVAVSATSPYTFTNVTADHVISATFAADSAPMVTGGGPLITGSGYVPPVIALPTTSTPVVTVISPIATLIIINGCDNRTSGFSVTTGASCAGNVFFLPFSAGGVPAENGGGGSYNLGTTTLRFWSKGEAVKELQRFLNKDLNLNLKVDGVLGFKTMAIVQQWQKAHGLVADGVVGAKTKLKMLGK